jgi:hypothetical protein
MKKHTLKFFLKIQLSILNVRIYFLINDLEFCLYDEDREILSKKLDYLLSKAHSTISQIEML